MYGYLYKGGNMADFDAISKAIIEGDQDLAVKLTKKALDENVEAQQILDKGLIPGIEKVGELFGAGEYFLPELLVSGEAMAEAIKVLEPALSQSGLPAKGKIAIGTVQGDVHNIGKDIVIMMLRGRGWDVTDLGVDVDPETFCALAKEGNYQILGLSSLLTMTMPNTVKTIKAIEEAGLRSKIKIMVGGAPTTKEWADKIGADGHASNASEVAGLVETLVK
jgi:5-methyltetrahydrofolate--homocysteine methyltransferase